MWGGSFENGEIIVFSSYHVTLEEVSDSGCLRDRGTSCIRGEGLLKINRDYGNYYINYYLFTGHNPPQNKKKYPIHHGKVQ